MKRKFLAIKSLLLICCFVVAFSMQAFSMRNADLSSNMQDKIFDALKNREATLELDYHYSGDFDELKKTVSDAIENAKAKEDDYTLYTIRSYAWRIARSDTQANIQLTFTYWNTSATDAFVSDAEDKILAQIITPDMDDFQKEKAIHDWIVKNVSYDNTKTKHSDYDALIAPNKTLCQGYSLLTYKMLLKAGVPNKIIDGVVSNGSQHTWNLVQLGGNWYHLDTTWDGAEIQKDNTVNSYAYFNLTDDQIKADHTWTKVYPVANTNYIDALNAKKSNNPELASVYDSILKITRINLLQPDNTASNVSDLQARLQKAVDSGEKPVKIRYLNKDTVKNDLTVAFTNILSVYSYSCSTQNYPITRDTGDVVLTISYTKK